MAETGKENIYDRAILFKWRQFRSEIILFCIHWYLRYSLSYRQREEMILERGLHVDYTTIYRWVQHYAPEHSCKVDETSINVKKEWVSLYCAIDSQGNTLDFFFSATRDAKAAKHFFLKILAASHTSEPRVIGHWTKTPHIPKHLQN